MRIHGPAVKAREGQGSVPKHPREIPAPTRLYAPPRAPRSHKEISDALVDRGDVELWIDPELLATPQGGTRGRPCAEGVILLAVCVGAMFRLPLRQTEGFCRGMARRVGGRAPSYSTICRRRATLGWTPPKKRGHTCIAIDATGIACYTPGAWMRARGLDETKATFVKLHVAIDQASGEILAWKLTHSAGRGTGDVSVGPALIEEAAMRAHLTGVLADRAYDAQRCYAAAADAGGRLLCLPKSSARRGLHPHRDDAIGHIGHVGEKVWKERVGYGQRAQVESVFSCLKRVFTEKTRATSFEGIEAEVGARIEMWNAWTGRDRG